MIFVHIFLPVRAETCDAHNLLQHATTELTDMQTAKRLGD